MNSTAESLGERRGYAPFSPDENSLVLFDGRAAARAGGPQRAAALGWVGVVSSCLVAQSQQRECQELSALTCAPPTMPRG